VALILLAADHPLLVERGALVVAETEALEPPVISVV
jgi:hypothetical protein